MPRSTTVRYTYEDYLTIPEDISHRHEIVDGELFVTAARRARHQQVVGNLFRTLGNLSVRHGLGEVFAGPITVRLHDEGVVEPDIVFVRQDRLDLVDPEGGVDGPPDLVVEGRGRAGVRGAAGGGVPRLRHEFRGEPMRTRVHFSYHEAFLTQATAQGRWSETPGA